MIAGPPPADGAGQPGCYTRPAAARCSAALPPVAPSPLADDRRRRLALIAAVLLLVIGCDQATKHLARTLLAPDTFLLLLDGVLVLGLADNAGAFLSLGATLPAAVRTALFGAGIGVMLIAVLAYLLTARLSRTAVVAGALLVGGGASNLLDRLLRSGQVTDFLLLQLGPLRTGVFNVADMAILAGAALLLLTARSHHAPVEPAQ